MIILFLMSLVGGPFLLNAEAVSGLLPELFQGEIANQNNPLSSQLSGQICDLYDDEQGIPHIRPALGPRSLDHSFAELAMLACFGYLHGRDRAWQIDFFRRTVQGRNAEVLGRKHLQSDFFMRLLGLADRAQILFHGMGPTDQNRFWAYSYGVNKGIQAALKKGVYEFRDLDYIPDPWTPENSVSLILLQSFTQTTLTFRTQLNEEIRQKLYQGRTLEIFDIENLPWNTTILKPGEFPRSTKSSRQTNLQSHLPVNLPEGLEEEPIFESSELTSFLQLKTLGEGSNNWVLSSSRGKGRNAWLANDPHLELKYPPFWHWANISDGIDPAEGGRDLMGAALPGVPFLVSGANRAAAWGVTNAYLPVSRISYVPEEELRTEPEAERPLIWIRFWKFSVPFAFKTFRRTREGWPVLPISAPPGKVVVLRWTGFDLSPSDLVSPFEFSKAKTINDVDSILSREGAPGWNFVFADHSGKIGYRAVGRTPRFKKAPDFGVPEHSLKELREDPAFLNPLRAHEMPHVINPARGFVVTANNQQWSAGAKFNLGRGPRASFRAFRIEELLLRKKQHDLKSLRKIQCDLQDVDGRFLAPLLVKNWDALTEKIPDPEPPIEAAVQKIRNWIAEGKFESSLECQACGIYSRWTERLEQRWKADPGGLFQLLGGGNDPREPEEEDRIQDALREELTQTVAEIGTRNWGELHLAFFRHLADPVLYTRNLTQAISTPGAYNSVNVGAETWLPGEIGKNEGIYEHTVGASHRMIVELSNPPVIHAVLSGPNQDLPPPSMSEPGSPWQDWLNCRLYRRHFPLEWGRVISIGVEL